MKRKTLETQLVRHCAAVLAGVKIANYYCTPESTALLEALKHWNLSFRKEKIRFRKLCSCHGRCGIFVYREDALQKRLNEPQVREILRAAGYRNLSLRGALFTLQQRLSYQRATKGDCFPHEIGIFLGYPVRDVEAFIHHKGKNALLVGPWKVYHDVKAAQRCFDQYQQCRQLFQEALASGTRLTTSVHRVRESLFDVCIAS